MDEVMEYVFFDQQLAERFKAACESLGVDAVFNLDQTPLGEASFSVHLSDQLEALLIEAVENIYEEMLFGDQAAMIEGNDEAGVVADSCGIQVQLSAGGYTNIAIEPVIINKLLSVLSTEELQSFVSKIADDIENPKRDSVCAQQRETTI